MQLHILKDSTEFTTTVADWMVEHINKTLQKQDRFTLVLSGGSTPKKLHELLASDAYKNKIDWSKVHCFWGDDRFVPFNDERNNAKMAFDTLLNHVPVAKEHIHVIQTEDITPEDSAKAYEEILKGYFPQTKHEKSPTFDLVLLGMGDDGHNPFIISRQN
jgi:6-phosphogluconolactonase